MAQLNLFKQAQLWFHAEVIDGKRVAIGGCEPDPKDSRDFEYEQLGGIFGFGEYKPQARVRLNKTMSVKNQREKNICGWCTVTTQKECDEEEVLSTKQLVAFARKKGLLSGTGLSNLRNNQLAVQEAGIAPESAVPDNTEEDWNTYSSERTLTPQVLDLAKVRRSQSSWVVKGRSNTLKLLDEGRTVATGMMWFSGFNMKGGFKAPWLITRGLGTALIGHAFLMKGYAMKFKGVVNNKIITGAGGIDVYVFQNSYSKSWGATVEDENGIEHVGLFFVAMDYFDKVGYSRWVQLDLPKETGKLLMEYNNKNVRNMKTGAIYRIENGVKRAYPDFITYLAFDNQRRGWSPLSEEELKQINDGPEFDIKQSPRWELIKEAVKEKNSQKIVQLLMEEDQAAIGSGAVWGTTYTTESLNFNSMSMENTKYFLKSKRFWGAVASGLGFAVLLVGLFFGKDLSPLIISLGMVLQAFGIPFQFYGGAVAEQKIGFKKQ